jgi:hypothetical protein
MAQEKATVQPVPTFRMTWADYLKLEAELPNCKLSREDSPEVACQKLGVALALQHFRAKFVVV